MRRLIEWFRRPPRQDEDVFLHAWKRIFVLAAVLYGAPPAVATVVAVIVVVAL